MQAVESVGHASNQHKALVTSVERGFRLGIVRKFRPLNVVILRVFRKTRTEARLESLSFAN